MQSWYNRFAMKDVVKGISMKKPMAENKGCGISALLAIISTVLFMIGMPALGVLFVIATIISFVISLM